MYVAFVSRTLELNGVPNTNIVVNMLEFGFQCPKMPVSRLEAAFSDISALLVFLIPVSEPKSSS